MKTESRKTKLRRLVAVTTALMLVASTMLTTAFAKTKNTAVEDARTGVFCIEYGHVKDSEFTPVARGSAFLINDDTMLTCSHVVHIYDDDFRDELKDRYGKDWEKHMAVQVILANGSMIPAKIILDNRKVDFAILQMSKKPNKHNALPLREKTVKSQERVSAMGFPYVVDEISEEISSKYTFEDVTTPGGQVTNPDVMVDGMHYIQHDATLRAGNSGGPLVDKKGNVVAINSAVSYDESYSYAIAIKEVLITLDQYGTEYTPAKTKTIKPKPDPGSSGSSTVPVEPKKQEVDTTTLQSVISSSTAGRSQSDYTAESWSNLQSALNQANAALSSNDQETVNKAVTDLNAAVNGLEEAKKPGVNPILIAGIAAAVIVVILIVVLAILLTRKKKPEPPAKDFSGFTPPPTEPTPVGAIPGKTTVEGGGFDTAPVQKVDYVAPSFGPEVGATGVLDSGSSETSVLFGGAGETTVLSGKPYAMLIRKSNNEKITASSANFIIGKERRRVDYCIENNSVSRNHAKLVNNNGTISIIDLGSTNGTFVNGVKCQPNVSVELKDGDKLLLADEEFEIKLL